MKKKFDSRKYLKQFEALEEAAKAEIIQILSENPKGRSIYFDTENYDENYAYCESAFVAMDGGDEVVIRICGVGLNDDNQIVIQTEYNEENWFEPDEWTHIYCELYKFVVDNLKYAKSSEPCDDED